MYSHSKDIYLYRIYDVYPATTYDKYGSTSAFRHLCNSRHSLFDPTVGHFNVALISKLSLEEIRVDHKMETSVTTTQQSNKLMDTSTFYM